MIPFGLSKIFIPLTKLFTSGTCAKTLFPNKTSACWFFSFNSFAVSVLKNFSNVGIPFFMALFATFDAGSIPNTGMLSSAKNFSK